MSNFYSNDPEGRLRFGDVIRFTYSFTPEIKNISNLNAFNINFEYTNFSVITTPCCTIEKSNKTQQKFISITPFLKIYSIFFKNDYFYNDLTLINKKSSFEKTIPKEKWESISIEEKQKLLEKGEVYPFFENFIYEKNDLLNKYIIKDRTGKNIESNYYMINFRYIHKINCDHLLLQELKVLQLSIETRADLIEKLNNYFRIPYEDIDE